MAVINGTSGNDNLQGGDSADFMYGMGGDDTLQGGAGNDALNGGPGNDVLNGGDGKDYAAFSDATAGVVANLRTGVATGGGGNDTLVSVESLYGSSFADALTGDDGANLLFGRAGDDTIDGGAGDDLLSGDDGNDVLIGGLGMDTASYTNATGGVNVNLAQGIASGPGVGSDSLSGIEHIEGSSHDDTLTGGSGDDLLAGWEGDDVIDGGDGTDTTYFSGNFADYTVSYDGEAGRFTVTDRSPGRDGVNVYRNIEIFQFNDVQKSAQQLGGAPLPDTTPPLLITLAPVNNATGVAPDSNIVATFSEPMARGTGTINLRLADGTLVESFDAATSSNITIVGNTVTLNPTQNLLPGTQYTVDAPSSAFKDLAGNIGPGNPHLGFTTGGTTQVGTTGNDTLGGGSDADLIDGGLGDDQIDGAAGNDTLLGGAGNDTLLGSSGDDTLDGGLGVDRMEGGRGADTYYVDNTADLVVELDNALGFTYGPRADLDLGGAIDKVVASVNFSLGDFVENLTLASAAGNLSGVGNVLDNVLTGNEGNNSLTGAGGNDSIDGGAGADTAVYSGNRADFSVSKTSTGLSVVDSRGTDGTDTLTSIERLQFADARVAVDTGVDQSAGGTALLIGAVLGQAALAAKKPLVGAVLNLFDQGYSLQTLCGAVMRLDIWGVLANGGAASASTTQIASYLLTTVNGSTPDATTLSAAVLALESETGAAQGTFLWHLAESAANQQQVNLVGLAQSGLEYSV